MLDSRLTVKPDYDLREYYKKIANHKTITNLPKENADYIKEALPNVTSCFDMMGNSSSSTDKDRDGCFALTSIDTTGWDTSNITNMDGMFSSCNALTTLDVSKWDTSKVTDMSYMFWHCNALTTLDISNWDTSKVGSMQYMFNRCYALTKITGIIDMKSCTSYDNMFYNCTKLTGVKIKNPPSGITATSGIGGLAAGKYEIVS